MKLQFAMLADYANITLDRKLNLMGIFNSIYVTDVPATHRSMQFVLQFELEALDHDTTQNVVIRFLDPDGESVLELTGDPVAVGQFSEHETIPQIIELANVTLAKRGDYAFSVVVNNEERVRVPLHVKQFDPGVQEG